MERGMSTLRQRMMWGWGTVFVVFLAFGIFMLGYSFGLDRAVRIAQEVMDTPSEAVEIHDPNPNSKYRVLNERHSIWDQDPLTPSPRQRCIIEGNEVICD